MKLLKDSYLEGFVRARGFPSFRDFVWERFGAKVRGVGLA
jgi:hypothetical protein